MAEKTLADIPVAQVWEAQQAALMRLQLYMVLRTHEMLREVLAECREALETAQRSGGAGEQGSWDGLSTHLAIEGVTQAWRSHFDEWKVLFERLRFEAGALPFGTLAVLHSFQFANADLRLGERDGQGRGGQGRDGQGRDGQGRDGQGRDGQGRDGQGRALPLQEGTVVFEPQLQAMLDAAAVHLWDDGFKLSDRIWRLDQESLEGIRQVVYEGVASGNSAWNVAQKLQQFLGGGQDCPRWARSRLYKLTKTEIASGDRTGLYSGEECDGQGVSYYALRLARNEIQYAHHQVTDALMGRIPWIEKEQVHLSPAHPVPDICDDAISNGEDGEGIYPKGTVLLPLHVQCLCYKSAVQMSPDEFAGKLRGWVNGTAGWPEMDEYASMLGTGREGIWDPSLAIGMADRLLIWLWGTVDDIAEAVG